MLQPKETTVGTIFLDDAAEKRLQALAVRLGGRVILEPTTSAAVAVAEALELVDRALAVVAAADLPPIIQDRVKVSA